MALFGRKKPQGDEQEKTPATAAGGNGAAARPPTPPVAGGGMDYSPDKAHKFFEHAAAVHEATNFAYAMTLWLGGLRQDPTSLAGLEGFFKSAGAYMNSGAKGPNKEALKSFSGRSELERYLRSLVEWSGHPADTHYAIRTVENAVAIGLVGPAVWLAERALIAAFNEKKQRKEYFTQLMELLEKLEKWDLAIQSGEAALRLDPIDGRLGAHVRNLSAQSTMNRSGFDQTGEAGGFRANIRDAAKQKSLEEEERVVKTGAVLDRLIEEKRAQYAADKLDRPTINALGKYLTDRGAPGDEDEALRLYDEAFRNTQEFRFRELGDRIRLLRMRRGVAALKREATETRDAGTIERFKAALREYRDAEVAAWEAQVAAYPTDLIKKFELGKRYFELERYEDAIAQFQQAKSDVKHRAKVLDYLGRSFQHIGWNDEATETLRQALALHPSQDDETGLELRYSLMRALMARAEESSALADAEEAYKIAQSISIQQISYKDIRARREEVKSLIARLRGGGQPAAST